MNKKIVRRISLCLFVALPGAWLHAQEFKVFDRTVQVHGFASQGFVHSDDNNWLTMNTSRIGSGEFTDFGANASTQITDKFRIGAQISTGRSATSRAAASEPRPQPDPPTSRALPQPNLARRTALPASS